MLGSAMYIWCKRQQIRHWTSRRLQSKLSSPSSVPLFGVLAVITLWTFLSKLSGLTPFAFSSSVGKQISKRIWTAALSYKQIKHRKLKKFLRSLICFHWPQRTPAMGKLFHFQTARKFSFSSVWTTEALFFYQVLLFLISGDVSELRGTSVIPRVMDC